MSKYRKFIREIERLSGVHVDAELTRSGHLRLRLPCGRFVIAMADIRRTTKQGAIAS